MSMMEFEPITLYGDGHNRRDWIHVDDHCTGLITVMNKGANGEVYCIGSGCELSNRNVVNHIYSAMEEEKLKVDSPTVFTNDRPTDDKRYAIDPSKLRRLGWNASGGTYEFIQNIRKLINWYKR